MISVIHVSRCEMFKLSLPPSLHPADPYLYGFFCPTFGGDARPDWLNPGRAVPPYRPPVMLSCDEGLSTCHLSGTV
jgi:hypothetical protein